MAHWSSYGDFDIGNHLEPCCPKSHSSSFFLQTEDGVRICLSCLAGLICDSTAFLIHRTYAIDEFMKALKDNLFSSDLMTYHDQLLVIPLSEALGSNKDAAFSKNIMASILTVCELAENYGKNLVNDFLVQIARQISAPAQWNRTQWHTLHLIGLLLELYCKENSFLPDAIRTQRGFFPNLISTLQDSGAELQGEVLFVLYKVASLEDGTESLLRCCPNVCKEAVHALLRSDSDELKINCLAFLTILAEQSILKIELSSDPEEEKRQLSVIRGSKASQTLPLSRTFVQAVKGCLLSSDTQVQASALRLFNLVYSDKTRLHDDLKILFEEGIVNYVVEILRISEELGTVQSLALNLLTLLSTEKQLYMHRFPLVVQTLVPILEKSIGSNSTKLQKDTLDLISIGVSEQPGVQLTALYERLLVILSELFEQYKTMMEDSVLVGGTVRLRPTFFSACSTLIALTEAPNFSLTYPISEVLQRVTNYAAEFAASDVQADPGISCLNATFQLLQAAYKYNQRHIQQNEWALRHQEKLIAICDEYLFPAFAGNVEKVENEDVVSTVYTTFTLILKTSRAEKTAQFAQRLALQKCFTLSYDLLARFSSSSLKEEIYQFMSSLIESLVGASFEAHVVDAFSYLPSNPTGLLLLLEQRSRGEERLQAAQHAVVSILSTSFLHNDRLSSEIDVIASLEQHLLLNKDSTLAETVASDQTLHHFLSLYVRGKRILDDRNVASSFEAEKVLELVLLQSKGRSLLCSKTPKDILRYFLQKDSLRNFTFMQLLRWFTAGESICVENQSEGMGSPSRSPGGVEGYEHLSTLADLLDEEPPVANVLLSLFQWLFNQGNDDGIGVVLRTITRLARMAPGVGSRLLSVNFEQNLLPLLHPLAVKVHEETKRFCLELLFRMLFDFHVNQGIMVGGSWLHVANQCAFLILVKAKVPFGEEVLPCLNLVNMIIFTSNEDPEARLLEASNLLARNRELCIRVEEYIIVASSQGEKLSKTSSISTEGQILYAAMIFHLLRLRWALKHLYTMRDHTASYFGFQATEWSKAEHCSKPFATSVTCKELCRILCHGPTALKLLSSYCIAEIFSQLHIKNTSDSLDAVKILDLPSAYFMAVTMTLQGCVLENLAVVSRNASSSLFLLMHSPALSPQQRRTVANSPWNRMLVEHLLASLSTAEGITCTCGRYPCHAAHIAFGILRITPSPEWLRIVFSPKNINDVVANLSEDKISPIIICIFQELLRLKYLTNDHSIRLRNLFQAIRKKLYDNRSVGDNTEAHVTLRNNNVSSTFERINHFRAENTLQNDLLELIIQASAKSQRVFCPEVDPTDIISDIGSAACISMIDKFMQDSDLFTD